MEISGNPAALQEFPSSSAAFLRLNAVLKDSHDLITQIELELSQWLRSRDLRREPAVAQASSLNAKAATLSMRLLQFGKSAPTDSLHAKMAARSLQT